MEPRLCLIQEFGRSLAVPISTCTSTEIVHCARFHLKEKGSFAHTLCKVVTRFGCRRKKQCFWGKCTYIYLNSLHRVGNPRPTRRKDFPLALSGVPILGQRTSSLPSPLCLLFTCPHCDDFVTAWPVIAKGLPNPALHKGEN